MQEKYLAVLKINGVLTDRVVSSIKDTEQELLDYLDELEVDKNRYDIIKVQVISRTSIVD